MIMTLECSVLFCSSSSSGKYRFFNVVVSVQLLLLFSGGRSSAVDGSYLHSGSQNQVLVLAAHYFICHHYLFYSTLIARIYYHRYLQAGKIRKFLLLLKGRSSREKPHWVLLLS